MTPRCPSVSFGHVSESEVTLWDGAGERQHFLLHLSLDLTERETKPKSKRQLSYTYINSPLTRREKTKHTVSNAFLRDSKKKKIQWEILTPSYLLPVSLREESARMFGWA